MKTKYSLDHLRDHLYVVEKRPFEQCMSNRTINHRCMYLQPTTLYNLIKFMNQENLSYIPLTSTPTLWTSISRYKSWILLLLIPLSTACINIVKKTFPIKGIIRPCSTHIRFCISLKKLFFETYYNQYIERHCLCKSFCYKAK